MMISEGTPVPLMQEVAYFHGGRPNMRRGEIVLPPSFSGTKVTLHKYGTRGVADVNKVYLTKNLNAAMIYAATYSAPKGGMVYECEPIGPIEPDPDCNVPDLSFMCDRARIIKCHRVGPRTREMILNAAFGLPQK